METINGLFKAECIRTTVFHGPQRIIGYVPPAEFEDRLTAALVEVVVP